MSFLKLCDGVRYVPKCDEPLSAEAFILNIPNGAIVFDVGASDEAFRELSALDGNMTVVLSHFHADHAKNIERLRYDRLIVGGFTQKKYGGEAAREDMYVAGAHIFPLPSSHAKGCLGLEFGGLAFLGDGAYACKDGYNVGVLKETIERLKSLSAERFVLSHSEPLIKSAGDVIEGLDKVYARRKKGEALLDVR